jgi:hypothetical protein
VGNPALEALLIASEERRLVDVRTISNAAGWTNANQGKPYRLQTGSTYTLVLIERRSPYTIDDLLKLSPRTFTRLPDGSYLLSENIVVAQGATLDLSSKEGVVLKMASNHDYFVSIVTIGGDLRIAGTVERPLEVMAWDASKGEVDTNTADGRAYLRVTGGKAALSDARFHHLGFWSGLTGGIAISGTGTPDVLADPKAETWRDTVADKQQAAAATRKQEVFGMELLPTGETSSMEIAPDLMGFSNASATVRNIDVDHNAYGLFVAHADGVSIQDSIFTENMVHGVMLHRSVINSVVFNSEASNNAVDGFYVSRATTGVVLDRVTSENNGRNGIMVSGAPLADGPNATGVPIGNYGNNQVTDSKVRGNGRYGIELSGGTHMLIDGNAVSGHDMGIVASNDMDHVSVTNNFVEASTKHGIALRGTVTDADVERNTVIGGETGIYFRDASGTIGHNHIEGVTNHAVSIVGTVGAVAISANVATGSGPSAFDTARTGQATVADNDASEWRSTKPLGVILRSIFQPLTIMWCLLGLLLLATAVTGLRSGRRRRLRDPFAAQAPLSSFTRGEITREEADKLRAAADAAPGRRSSGVPTVHGGDAAPAAPDGGVPAAPGNGDAPAAPDRDPSNGPALEAVPAGREG